MSIEEDLAKNITKSFSKVIPPSCLSMVTCMMALLNEPLKVKAFTTANSMLSAPPVLRVLGPKAIQRALEFITNGTIWAMRVDMTFLAIEHSSPVVDAIWQAINQAGRNTQPATVILPPATSYARQQ
uniref:Uncharacterized protein n=1 Tax=Romanomermis culicivorax TaxID=13658 RepID=A0A915L030_ROMCU